MTTATVPSPAHVDSTETIVPPPSQSRRPLGLVLNPVGNQSDLRSLDLASLLLHALSIESFDPVVGILDEAACNVETICDALAGGEANSGTTATLVSVERACRVAAELHRRMMAERSIAVPKAGYSPCVGSAVAYLGEAMKAMDRLTNLSTGERHTASSIEREAAARAEIRECVSAASAVLGGPAYDFEDEVGVEPAVEVSR